MFLQDWWFQRSFVIWSSGALDVLNATECRKEFLWVVMTCKGRTTIRVAISALMFIFDTVASYEQIHLYVQGEFPLLSTSRWFIISVYVCFMCVDACKYSNACQIQNHIMYICMYKYVWIFLLSVLGCNRHPMDTALAPYCIYPPIPNFDFSILRHGMAQFLQLGPWDFNLFWIVMLLPNNY